MYKEPPQCFSLSRAGLAAALAVVLLGAAAPRLAAQSQDFNSGSDGGWTHYSVTPDYLPTIPPGYPVDTITFTNGYDNTATFTYPTDPSGGYHYRLQSPPIIYDYWHLTPDYPTYGSGAGPSRAASYPSTTYLNTFSVGADLVAWNNYYVQYVGLIGLAQNIGLGTSQGYGAIYSLGYKNIYVSSISGEQPTTIGQLADGSVVLNPTHQYRMVLSSPDAQNYLFQVFDKSQPANSPWISVIGNDGSYFGYAGVCGLLTYNYDEPPPNENPGNSSQGTDATFDNYVASAPTVGANPSFWPATVTDLYPPPAGKGVEIQPTMSVGIFNRETAVTPSSIDLYLDGASIGHGSLTIDTTGVHKPNNPSSPDFPGATVTYLIPTVYPSGSVHSSAAVFMDDQGVTHSNYWTWTSGYGALWASNSLPVGSLTTRGFDARMVHSIAAGMGGTYLSSTQADIVNSLQSAQAVLAGTYASDLSATNWTQRVAWALNGTDNGAVTNFPGLCIPPADGRSFAVETFTYLHLTAGVHHLYVDSDDCVGIYSGTNLTDTSSVIGEFGRGLATNLAFVVESEGLYPFHIIYQQGGGSAHLVLKSESSSGALVNDTGGFEAYYPFVFKSSTAVKGPYTADAAANSAGNVLGMANDVCGGGAGPIVNLSLTGGTNTFAAPTAPKFYRLDGPRKTNITGVNKSGANLVITYTGQ